MPDWPLLFTGKSIVLCWVVLNASSFDAYLFVDRRCAACCVCLAHPSNAACCFVSWLSARRASGLLLLTVCRQTAKFSCSSLLVVCKLSGQRVVFVHMSIASVLFCALLSRLLRAGVHADCSFAVQLQSQGVQCVLWACMSCCMFLLHRCFACLPICQWRF